jgi:hypothetical protein
MVSVFGLSYIVKKIAGDKKKRKTSSDLKMTVITEQPTQEDLETLLTEPN